MNIKFIDILLEDKPKKEKQKISFHTYYCEFVVKLEKRINKSQVLERIRGIKSVTIVKDVPNSKIDSINRNLKDQEYVLLGIKFITNKNAMDQIKNISFDIAKADSGKDIINIKGTITAKPRLDSLIKIE